MSTLESDFWSRGGEGIVGTSTRTRETTAVVDPYISL